MSWLRDPARALEKKWMRLLKEAKALENKRDLQGVRAKTEEARQVLQQLKALRGA